MNNKGFSVVEMLVAIILLSMLIGVSIYGFKMQSSIIKKSGLEELDSAIKFSQIKGALESIKYYVVRKYDALYRPIKWKEYYYFTGKNNKMIFISENTMFSNKPAVVELACQGSNLFYKEEPLYGRIDYKKPSIVDDSIQKIFFRNITYCKFYYMDKDGRWRSHFSDEIPISIKLDLILEDEEQILIYSNVMANVESRKLLIQETLYDEF